jgi:hypothetical protein
MTIMAAHATQKNRLPFIGPPEDRFGVLVKSADVATKNRDGRRAAPHPDAGVRLPTLRNGRDQVRRMVVRRAAQVGSGRSTGYAGRERNASVRRAGGNTDVAGAPPGKGAADAP